MTLKKFENDDKQAQADQRSDDKKKNAVFLSDIYTQPVMSAAYTINNICNKELDIVTLARNINEQIQDVHNGDLRRIEQMLITQAHTLNVVFNHMMTQMANAPTVEHLQAYSDIALKSQNQCRKALVALGELKHPRRTTFVKQQNVALNQQINNVSEQEKSKKTENITNELLSLEEQNATLDTRRTFTPIPVDTELEAVEISRGKNS